MDRYRKGLDEKAIHGVVAKWLQRQGRQIDRAIPAAQQVVVSLELIDLRRRNRQPRLLRAG